MTSHSEAQSNETVSSLAERLRARASNAYFDYIAQCRRDECLGWQAKVEQNAFGWPEIAAHTKAGELLGRHRALNEAADALSALKKETPNVHG